MAKRKKVTRPAPKKFLVLRTDCGDASQLGAIGNYESRTRAYHTENATEEDARKSATNYVEYNGSDIGVLVIVQILDVAKASGVTFTGKTSL